MSFSLAGQGLKLNTREDIEPYIKSIDPTTLEEIHLGGNTIGVEAAQALAEVLHKAEKIRIADFADIFTGRLISEIPQALSALCDSLIDKTHLVEIDLSDNAFGGRSVDPIVPFLTQNRVFQVLKLNNNGLGPAGGEVIANALRASAELSRKEGKRSSLRTVICGRNRLENGSASAWAAAFEAHGTLEEVRMPQNGIRMEGITALASGLASNTGLRYLDLQDNTFSQDGDGAFAKALPSWPTLHTLNFSDCVLSEEGEVPQTIATLAKGSNPLLRDLQLQNNNLDTKTAEVLAEAIGTYLKDIVRMELQWNEFEEEDEFVQTLIDNLTARGGKFLIDDEDEEEEEKEAEDEEDEEAVAEAESNGPAAVTDASKSADDKAADDLADLLGKVSITQS
ncbi:RNI-like protein [Artomyces pyxidatus]|uniref:RNI-like protein n=1 Tax=Artomyces pyxidatus TaxID=48021 RepID=A0ACB8T5W8_9AGAM|nr:RNI-like protein [Artomyces pyxidatus]